MLGKRSPHAEDVVKDLQRGTVSYAGSRQKSSLGQTFLKGKVPHREGRLSGLENIKEDGTRNRVQERSRR